MQPIKTLQNIYTTNNQADKYNSVFEPGYLNTKGSIIPSSDNDGYIIIADTANNLTTYSLMYYQRVTHYQGKPYMHNYHVYNRQFKHASSARRYAKQL